ncbi:PilN domain-containing protein [Geobacter sp. DSM 9736]|uniref:PilN domain-containing protein n=1 Tax=Geobacter sp. DSM 9736 TaxID=1277350 RepID=UPI000B4FD7C0|nr:PilN domain-containing protein [Geobacter sp. DSM 9736]SNB45279.1 type IV pilus assembly protein PilN [Geobacter sp. DSM 9736]
MRLKINLASRTYLNRRQFNVAIALAFAVLGLVLVFNIGTVSRNAGEISIAARQIAQYEGKLTGAVPEQDYKALLDRIKFANEIIDRKTYRWTALLDKLEGVVPEGIAITTIDPDTKTGKLKISGAARSFKNLRQFLENLEGSEDFAEVFLVSQADVKVGQTQQGISFSIDSKVRLP